MVLCITCSVPWDYGNGWVYCPYRSRWLQKGYEKCKGYEKGERDYLVHKGAEPSKLFQDSGGSK